MSQNLRFILAASVLDASKGFYRIDFVFTGSMVLDRIRHAAVKFLMVFGGVLFLLFAVLIAGALYLFFSYDEEL